MVGEIFKTEGIFIGEEFVKKGEKKDKDDKAVPWTMNKLKFKRNENAPFAIGFGTFDTEAIKKYNLTAGEWYIIEYREQPNKTYPDKPHKSFVTANKGRLPQNHEERVATMDTPKLDLAKEFGSFVPFYKEAVPKERQQPLHMVGMFLVNTFPDQFWELYAKCCKELGVEVPKR
jgi:hypothetical protein